MTTKHICRVVVLGVIVEAAAAIATAYELLRVVGWIGEHLPDWTVPVGFMAIPALALIGVLWDNRHSVELTDGDAE